MNKKISVIIPIYNAGKYLAETLNCVLGQTYKNLEIICILDAPTDNSEEILKKFKDKRIKIIKLKKNVGAAEARNIALKVAIGEWLHFMDADDFITPNFYERMVACGSEVNVVASSVFYEANPKHSIWFTKNEIVTSRKKWNKTEALIHGWMWRYLIRANFWRAHNLSFPKLIVMEDMPTMIAVIFYAKKVALSKDSVYFYKNRTDSIVNKIFTDKKRSDWQKGRTLMHSFMRKHKIKRASRVLYLLKRM